MHENEIATKVLDKAFQIHRDLGPGLLESVYEPILADILRKDGLLVHRQVGIPVFYNDMEFALGFRADLVVENKLIIEVKSVERTLPVHKKQLWTYIKLANMRLGLVLNFGAELLKHGITRVVNGLEDQSET